jgi:2-octaprenyl-6-methoxyphenol hydroxylase
MTRDDGKSLTRDPADVLIIGGGMAGLTLGCALGSAGVPVVLVESLRPEQLLSDEFDGRTTAVAAGSQAALSAIGVWQAIAPEAQPILDIRVSDGHSPLFLHYDHRDVGGEALGYIVENRVIRRALLDNLAGMPSVTLSTGRRVATLLRDDTLATATLDDDTVIRTRLAVATDGRNSPTRQAAGIEATAWRYKQIGIVCTVNHEFDHRGVAQEHFLPAGPFAILPMTERRSSIVWTERADLAPALLALDDAEFLAELSLRFEDYLGKLEIIGPRFSYPLGLMHAHRYIAPRLALAGDAAHAIHPIAGQGLNIGWRDVAALAEVVIDALRLGCDPGSEVTLQRYQRWRRVDNAMMLAATDALNRLFSNDIMPIRLARDVGLASVNRAPPLKRLFMRHAMGVLGDVPRLVRGEAL